MRFSSSLLLCAALLTLSSCGPAEGRVADLPPAEPMSEVQPVVSRPFGGAVRGRVAWLSANGRMAAIYRFTRDTNGDGRVEPRFGFHGEMMADTPDLWLYDLATGDSVLYEDLLDGDPTLRYMALVRSGRAVLLDSRDGRLREMAELQGSEGDGNPCMAPRQFSFSDDGGRIAYLRGDPPELVIRTLATGRERVVRAGRGVIWRAALPADTGWTLLYQVDPPSTAADSARYPVQRTSCASRASNLFASSYSYMGWEGAPFRTVLVGPDGTRSTVSGNPVTLGESGYAVPDSARLFTPAGEPIPLPDGCTGLTAISGFARVVLRCGNHSAVFDPRTRAVIRLPVALSFDDEGLGGVHAEDGDWVAALVSGNSVPRRRLAAGQLVRLRLDDGRMEAGPVVTSPKVAQDPDWAVGQGDDGVYALNLRTGEFRTVAVEDLTYVDGFALRRRDAQLIMNPARGTWFRAGKTASAATPSGCVLEAAQRDARTETGPWTRRCTP